MSRFKNRKFELQWDSRGTNAWVPLEQVHALLCDAMALEAENERLRSASFVTAVPSEEYEKLKADNERLRNYLERIDLAINQSRDKAIDILIEWRREQGDLP